MLAAVIGRWGKKVRVSSCGSLEKAVGVWTQGERGCGWSHHRGGVSLPCSMVGRKPTRRRPCWRASVTAIPEFHVCLPAVNDLFWTDFLSTQAFRKTLSNSTLLLLKAECTAYSYQPGKQWPGSRREWGMQLRRSEKGWQRWQAIAVWRVELPPSVQFWWRDNFVHYPTKWPDLFDSAISVPFHRCFFE